VVLFTHSKRVNAMADKKLADLTAHTTVLDADLSYIETAGAERKLAQSDLKSYMSASPTLVTPALGTPASGDLSNCNEVGKSVTTGITAYATGGQANAVALTSEINVIGTVGTADDSVKLPTAAAGLEVTVINQTTTAAEVFPVSGGYIDGAAINVADALPGKTATTYVAVNATNWYTKATHTYT
jgi:hypothetical protein